jgi:hypothetical protein
MHSTNYRNTFIEASDDCRASEGLIPPDRDKKTIARLQYEIIHGAPYKHTSDDVVFLVHSIRKGIKKSELKNEREAFFAKGQACMRASPLGKSYGWGIHFNDESRVALYSMGSEEYQKLQKDDRLEHLKAMRTNKIA